MSSETDTPQEAPEAPQDSTQAAPEPSQQPEAKPADWMTGADDDTREWATQWGYDEPMKVVKALRSMEKTRGAAPNELAKIPKEDDAEGWNEFYGKIGRPATPDEYELETRVVEEGMVDLRPLLIPKAHEMGLNQRQVHALDSHLNGVIAEIQAKQAEEADQHLQEARTNLQAKWKDQYERKSSAVRAVMRKGEISDDQFDGLISVLGAEKAMEWLSDLGEPLLEDGYVDGDTPDLITTSAADRKLAELKASGELQKIQDDKRHPLRQHVIDLYKASSGG